jgi:zinc protease
MSNKNKTVYFALCRAMMILVSISILVNPLCAEDHILTTDRKLSNGVQLILSPTKGLAIASVQLWLRSGQVDDPPDLKGSGELISKLLGGPVIARRLADTVPSLQEEGIVASSDCFDDSMVVSLTGPSARAPEMMEALARLVKQPTFTRSEFDAAKSILNDETRRKAENSSMELEQHLLHLCYSIHPYRNHPLDALENIESIKSNDISNEIKRRLEPENMIITVAGGIDVQELIVSATSSFEEVRAGQRISRPAIIEPKAVTQRSFISRGTFSTNRVMLGYLMPPAQSSEVYALMLLAELLDSYSASELRRELMDQLPQDSTMTVSFQPRRDPGLFIVNISASKLDPVETRERLSAILSRAGTRSLRLADLARAKEKLKILITWQFSTPSRTASELGQWTVLEHKVSYDKIISHIDRVTIPDLNRIIDEYFDNNFVAMAAQSRILLEPKAAFSTAKPNIKPIEIETTSKVALILTNLPEASFSACNLILPVKALARDSENVHSLLRLRKLLRHELIRENQRPGMDRLGPEMARLLIMPRSVREAPDAIRIEFSSTPSKFVKVLEKILKSFMLCFEKSFTKGSLKPEEVIVSISGNVDGDLCRKAVNDVFNGKNTSVQSSGEAAFSPVEPQVITGDIHLSKESDKLIIIATAPKWGSHLQAATYCYGEILKTRLIEKLRTNEGLLRDVEVFYHPAEDQGKFILAVGHTSQKKALILQHLLKELKLLANKEYSSREIEQGISLCRFSWLADELDSSVISEKVGLNKLRKGQSEIYSTLFKDLTTISGASLKKVAEKIFSTAEPVLEP